MSDKNKKPYKVLFDYPVRVESVKPIGPASGSCHEVILRPSGINKGNPIRLLLENIPDCREGEELRISVQKCVF